jgi:hypothetical protein
VQRYAPFAFLCGSSLTVIEASNPGVFIVRQKDPGSQYETMFRPALVNDPGQGGEF